MSSRVLFPRVRESKFRGNTTYKPTLSSLPLEETYRVLSKGASFGVNDLIQSLTAHSRVGNPSFDALSILANRAANSSSFFYPPQILQAISLFQKISYSQPELFEFIASRKTDLLNEASPRRIVTLVSAMADLHLPLFHGEIWPEIRSEICKLAPQFRRGIPKLVRSLVYQNCADVELLNGLLTQAVCLVESGELERSVLIHSIFEASKIGLGKEFFNHISLENATLNQSVYLAGIALRMGQPWERFESQILTGFNGQIYSTARLIQLCFRVGVASRNINLAIAQFLENNLENADYCRKFLPYNLFAVSAVGDFANLVLKKVSPAIDTYSAEKLLLLARASLVAGNDSADLFMNAIKPIARQLTVRQSRLLWECAPGIIPVHALPPLVAPGTHEIDTVVVGPYTLTNQHTLTLPKDEIFVPGSTETRPEISLRLNALKKFEPQTRIVPL